MLDRLALRDRLIRALRFSPPSGADAVRQFQLSLLLLVGLLVVGVIGYVQLAQMSWIDAAYMTVITLTTVGFGEVRPLNEAGRLFTMLLIMLGVSLSAYALRNVVEIAVGDRLWVSLGERQLQQQLSVMHNHYIVCGYGRMGREIVREFQRRNESFVVVDKSDAVHTELLESGIVHVVGDATHDEVLIQAGVAQAKGLLAVASSDADNVLIVLSAKGLNSLLKVVARAATDEMESKLRRAGADIVTSPYVIGGQRMAFALVRPAVYQFLNTVVYSEALHIEMGQMLMRPHSPLVGSTLRQANLRERWGVFVVAILDRAGQTLISPDPNRRIEEGDTLIVVAPTEVIQRLEDGNFEAR